MDEQLEIPTPPEPEEGAASAPSQETLSANEMQRLHQDAKEYKEKYLHALAEGENSRKRLQKERQEMIQHAIQNVIVEFLNPIDQLENALKYAEQASPEVKNWAVGFEMILGQLKNVLSNHGVSPYQSEGHLFDPHYHEAIDVIETEEHPPGTVIKEHVRGYKMTSGRVIRPARVHVSKLPGQTAASEEKSPEASAQENTNETN